MGKLIEHQDYLVKPDGFNIPMMRSEFNFYWISSRKRNLFGGRFDKFNEALGKAKFIVGQNLGFDLNIMGSESSFGIRESHE
jgi:DNA polymerase-3 subunit alpha